MAKKASSFNKIIDKVLETDTSKYERSDLGELSFEKLRPQIEITKRLLQELIKIDPVLIPPELESKIRDRSTGIFVVLNSIENFKLKNIQGNPNVEHETIIRNFNREYSELLDLLPLINLAERIDEHEVIKRNENIITLIDLASKTLDQKLLEFNKKIEETTTAVEEATKTRGVSVFAEIFEAESNRYSRNAFWWLIGTIGLLILTVTSSVALLFFQKEGEFGFDHIQFMITKVLIISALFYSISVCVKNFKAQKHNELVNRHRFNALKTFQTFTTSTKDERTKDVILLEATHTIFGHQTTGYNDNDSNDSDLPTKVLDAIKSSDKS